jgi:glutamate synthase domain-containing protein 2
MQMDWLFFTFLGSLAALLVVILAAFLLRSAILNRVVDRAVNRLFSDPYAENLWELVTGMHRFPPQEVFEMELRAEMGQTIWRPMGTVRKLPDFGGITFNPAQLVRPPLGPKVAVDLATRIGPRCQRPLLLQMPILISAMGYGLALSRQYVTALVRAANAVGTVYNGGSGPVLDEVLQQANHLVMQYAGAPWTRDRQRLAEADAIEIRYGHGARAALGRVIPTSELPVEMLEMLGLADNSEAVYEAPLPGAATPAELRALVPELRQLIKGGPVGVKLAATHDLERELAAVLEAGVDYIALDGAQGGTHGTPPIIADNFGIPTIHALHRAATFLERSGARQQVSLIICGGLRNPGDFLKAMALGADAVYVATAVLYAAAHGQVHKALPFEPLTEISWATGKLADTYDPDQGAKYVTNYLRACAGELSEAARALGKQRLAEIDRSDLVAWDPTTAAALGLPPTWLAPRGQPAPGGTKQV